MSSKLRLRDCVTQWIVNQFGNHVEIGSIRKLDGSTSSTLYQISALINSEQKNYVIRLFDQKDWVEEEPDLALHEANSLKYAAQIDAPTPKFIAFDEHGSECGIPLVLMTFCEGYVQLKPRDMSQWINGLARSLVGIHELDGKEFGWEYSPYQDVHNFDIPTWSSVPHLWEKAIQIVKGPQPQDKTRYVLSTVTITLQMSSGKAGK